MQVCKANLEQKQVFGESLEGNRIMMENDRTIKKTSFRRRSSRVKG